MDALQPIETKPDRLVIIAFDAIRDAIVNKKLKPGARISEARLAEQLGISKTPVREALVRLEGIGLVVPDGNRGSRVVWPSPEAIQHAFEVRGALEALAARRAAENAGPEHRTAIQDIAVASLQRAEDGDGDGFRKFDRELHAAIAQATGNELLTRLADNAYTLAWALRRRDAPSIDYQVSCAREHIRIADAIAAGEAATAEGEMRAHISSNSRFVLDAFTREKVGADMTADSKNTP